MVLGAYAALNHPPHAALDALTDSLLIHLDDYPPQELAMAVHAYARHVQKSALP
jgi:hypothetical protein